MKTPGRCVAARSGRLPLMTPELLRAGVNPGVREIGRQAFSARRVILDLVVRHNRLNRRDQIDHRQILRDDHLELLEQFGALVLIGLLGCGFEQLVDFRVFIMAGVRERQTDLEILAPLHPLHARRWIKGIGQRFRREVSGAVGVDRLHIGDEIELLDRGFNADIGERLLDEGGVAHRVGRIVGDA